MNARSEIYMAGRAVAGREQAVEETWGYCQSCGGYGRGRFVEVINSHSDAIDQCQDCSIRAVPASGQPGALGPQSQQAVPSLRTGSAAPATPAPRTAGRAACPPLR